MVAAGVASISRSSTVSPTGKGSSSAPASPACSWRGLSFGFSPSVPGPPSGDASIGQQAPSGFGGASSSAAGTVFNSDSRSGAGKVCPTGSVEFLGSSSTSIFCALSCLLLGCYLSLFSGRYDLPGVCWPFYRLQPWPSRVLIGAPRSRDRLGWLASGWLSQGGGVQPLRGWGAFPRCISGGWVFPLC